MQAQRCLTAAHVRCERYVAHHARTGRARPGVILGDGLVSTRMVIAPDPVWRGIAGRARRAPRGPMVAGALALAAVTVGGVAVAGAALDGRLGAVLGSPSARPVATPSSSGSRSATPVQSASPTLDASPSRLPPTPAATPTPTVATPTLVASPAPTPPPQTPAPPPPQESYVVQQGDTLALIAAQFGTSVEALQAANGIDDPDEIVIGQVLVIP